MNIWSADITGPALFDALGIRSEDTYFLNRLERGKTKLHFIFSKILLDRLFAFAHDLKYINFFLAYIRSGEFNLLLRGSMTSPTYLQFG